MPPPRIALDHLSGQPGLGRAAQAALVERQPATVLEALQVRGVGRKTTKRLLALGLIADPERLQHRSMAQVFGRYRAPPAEPRGP